MYKGSCLCGSVKFEVKGSIENIVHCHCIECRKAHGAAFATLGLVDLENFVIVCGEEIIEDYESSPGKHRCFCRKCGSPVLSKRDALPNKLRIRIGSLEGNISEVPEAHIFSKEKANWVVIGDDLPLYDGFE